MLGFCVGVLLISCVNVMNMQFARATLRAKELAVRSSLGATRIRLIRQMLTESLLRAIGAAVGIGLAYAVDRLAVGHRLQPREPAAVVDHVRRRRPGAGVHRLRDACRGGVLRAAAGADVVARQRADVLREGGRGNTSRSVGS